MKHTEKAKLWSSNTSAFTSFMEKHCVGVNLQAIFRVGEHEEVEPPTIHDDTYWCRGEEVSRGCGHESRSGLQICVV